jgi:hypothetical protein
LWESITSSGYIVVYAVSDWPSFKSAERCCQSVRDRDTLSPVWLVGTMLDAKRRVTNDGARASAHSKRAPQLQTPKNWQSVTMRIYSKCAH